VKIDRIETFLVAPRWLLVRLETDDGLVGWGEATLESRCEPVAAAIQVFAEYLLGQDPTTIERHWQVLSKSGFYRGGPVLSSAVAGIDQALWDLLGKSLDTPVHVLLGGAVRDRVRVYSWIGGDDPTEIAENAAQQLEAGFSAVKMNAAGALRAIDTSGAIDATLQLAAAAREAMGADGDFALDFHGRFSTPMARRVVAELEPLRPLFVEEPVLPEYAPHTLKSVVDATSIPIAAGERCYNRTDFLPLLQAGLAVAQPDLAHCGGISEARRIASLAETFDAVLAPHCPLGPLALAASLQISFTTPNFLIQEQSMGIHYNTDAEVLDYVLDASVFDFDDGYCNIPTKPGLGLDIDEHAVRTAADSAHSWRGPVWFRDDGAMAEW
jgi:galactonate dehydratase